MSTDKLSGVANAKTDTFAEVAERVLSAILMVI
jgi:hypothetical protein